MNLLFPYASRPKSLRWEKIIYQIWGSMGNLAFIAATILIIGLLWSESAQNSKLWLQGMPNYTYHPNHDDFLPKQTLIGILC